MPPPGKKPRRQFFRKSDAEAAEIEELERRIAEGAPPPASSHPGKEDTEGTSYAFARKFLELPLSQHTQTGLKEAKFKSLTAIQRFALPQALCGRDILGAAKTGSGKTLAFLIPLLEKLYRLKWGPLDGLGALVISPTRELALQIFDELRKIGKHHEFSAGLLIGGKNVREEQERVRGMNILVCTPGRLLQHMDETPGFDASSLQLLVLDEADRILDMVKQLARLNLKDPQYVSVHENAEAPTPAKLEQAFAVCELSDKLSVLWSFIRSHLKAKILVFVSTTRQTRFLFEAFKKLRPGCPLRSLHGNMKQNKRMAVFYDFAQATSGMVLFATDIAARGLDFTKLDWVVQLDCPEDTGAYIHRVGRTARYVSAGRSLLLLLPSEKVFIEQLKAARIPIKSIKINPEKTQPLQPALQALLSKFQDLKAFAESSMTAYLKSVHLAPNKAVFDVNQLPIEDFAASLGLLAIPKLNFAKKGLKRAGPGGSLTEKAVEPLLPERAGPSPDVLEEEMSSRPGKQTDEDEDEEENLLSLKKTKMAGDGPQSPGPAAVDSEQPKKKKRKKLKIKPEALSASRVVFDEEGAALDPLAALAEATDDREVGESLGHSTAAERYRAAAAVLRARDTEDKQDYKDKRRSRMMDAKAKRRAREEGAEAGDVSLGPGLGYPGEESRALEEAENGPGKSDKDESDGWNSDLEEEALAAIFGTKKRKRKTQDLAGGVQNGPEKAHVGMSTKPAVELTLAQQEELALKLIRPW